MPFSSAESSVVAAVNQMNSQLQSMEPSADPHMGELWAKVATAFFSSGSSPLWLDYSAGEAAFKGAAGKSITEASFKLAWWDYAKTGLATAPVPPALSYTPPPAPPDFSSIAALGGQDSPTPAAKALFATLDIWIKTGTGILPAPATPQTWI